MPFPFLAVSGPPIKAVNAPIFQNFIVNDVVSSHVPSFGFTNTRFKHRQTEVGHAQQGLSSPNISFIAVHHGDYGRVIGSEVQPLAGPRERLGRSLSNSADSLSKCGNNFYGCTGGDYFTRRKRQGISIHDLGTVEPQAEPARSFLEIGIQLPTCKRSCR